MQCYSAAAFCEHTRNSGRTQKLYLMSLQGDSDAHEFEHLDIEHRADGEGQTPSWNANGCSGCREKGREGMWAALGPVPQSSPLCSHQPGLALCGRGGLASIHCKKSAVGWWKSSVCSNTVTGAAPCSSILCTCTAQGQGGRGIR